MQAIVGYARQEREETDGRKCMSVNKCAEALKMNGGLLRKNYLDEVEMLRAGEYGDRKRIMFIFYDETLEEDEEETEGE